MSTQQAPVRAQLNQVFSAALREVITDTAAYDGLYLRYMGIAPLYPPTCDDCGGWVPIEDMEPGVRKLLEGGVLRFGYVSGTPYVYGNPGEEIGFDHDLAGLAVARIQAQYRLAKLEARWVVGGQPPVSEASRLDMLYSGLVKGVFDIAMSGQLEMAAVDAPDAHPEFTCATSRLFTGIYYSGRDGELMRPVLEKLVGGTRKALIDTLNNAWPTLEILVVSASNPGPSPTAAVSFVSDVVAGGGKAWCTFSADTDLVKRTFIEQQVHFAIGDSNQNSALCATPGFAGLNLDIPAIDGQDPLPLAAFTRLNLG